MWETCIKNILHSIIEKKLSAAIFLIMFLVTLVAVFPNSSSENSTVNKKAVKDTKKPYFVYKPFDLKFDDSYSDNLDDDSFRCR